MNGPEPHVDAPAPAADGVSELLDLLGDALDLGEGRGGVLAGEKPAVERELATILHRVG
jgi:hypothetical protein